MDHQWKSIGIYEHPAKHQAGTYGNVNLSTAGVYTLRVGSSIMSCPQDWASKIHKEEGMGKENLSIRGIDRDVWRQFRGKCVLLGVTVGDRLNQLIAEDITIEATTDDLLKQAVKEG